ncbi:MAG: hypothetical protein K6F47_06500 [Bacteroidaceae bacterium]|nr:hypothetical protein [Bacteroidaceae bacterium]
MGAERSVGSEGVVLRHHVHVGVHLGIGNSPGDCHPVERIAVGGCQLDVLHVVVRAGEGEVRVLIALPVEPEAVVADEHHLPCIPTVRELQAVVELYAEARGVGEVLDGRRLRAGAVALTTAGREGERPSVRVIVAFCTESVGHGLVGSKSDVRHPCECAKESKDCCLDVLHNNREN